MRECSKPVKDQSPLERGAYPGTFTPDSFGPRTTFTTLDDTHANSSERLSSWNPTIGEGQKYQSPQQATGAGNLRVGFFGFGFIFGPPPPIVKMVYLD